jgi:hypothetical protein
MRGIFAEKKTHTIFVLSAVLRVDSTGRRESAHERDGLIINDSRVRLGQLHNRTAKDKPREREERTAAQKALKNVRP